MTDAPEPTAEMREVALAIARSLRQFIVTFEDGADVTYLTKDGIDFIAGVLAAGERRARADERERCAKIAEAYKHPSCPFDGPNEIEPHQPCPVCGDYGNDFDAPMKCPGSPRHNIARAIRESQRMSTPICTHSNSSYIAILEAKLAAAEVIAADYSAEIDRLRARANVDKRNSDD